jgi:hypothetical protein
MYTMSEVNLVYMRKGMSKQLDHVTMEHALP